MQEDRSVSVERIRVTMNHYVAREMLPTLDQAINEMVSDERLQALVTLLGIDRARALAQQVVYASIACNAVDRMEPIEPERHATAKQYVSEAQYRVLDSAIAVGLEVAFRELVNEAPQQQAPIGFQGEQESPEIDQET